jgi:hypothetical protein
MVPACRTEGEAFAISTFDVTPRDEEGFMEELWEFQSALHDCFARSEACAHFFDYKEAHCAYLRRREDGVCIHPEIRTCATSDEY